MVFNTQEKIEEIKAAYEKESKRNKPTEFTWIADTGASCHMTHDDTGMTEVREIDEEVKIGDRRVLKATKIGKILFIM